jgi:NodT family efflux transporter outer membrane factor (OMF) lipoprotein
MTLALSACAVGPNYQHPAQPTADAYTREPLPAQTQSTAVAGGEAQRFQFGHDLPASWWTLFGSRQLDALIKEALEHYPNIAAQQAALRAARENVRAQEGVFYPQVRGSLGQTRQKQSGDLLGPGVPSFITSVYTASVNVSYTFDLFGGDRRALESSQAQADAQKFQLEASYLTLTSNVAATAIQLAAVREQIAATHEIVSLEEQQLKLIQRQFEVGSRARADVLQQESNLATVRATLPSLQQQLAASEHQLAVLTGHFPHDAAEVEIELSDLKLPQDVPVSLPSALVEQRPDIKVQEMLMRQASAGVGVATANMLPQLTLTASTGGESLRIASVLDPQSSVWSIATGLTQPLFAGGSLRAKRRAAIDTFQQTEAQYRLSVLNAFQNVADSLTALDNDAQALRAEFDAVKAAKSSLDLIQRQYDAGAVGYVSLLTAQQTYQQARIAYVRAVASRYTDTVTLFQALGGGWWNRERPTSL